MMKKFNLLVFSIALVPLMSACQDKQHSIIAINTMGNEQSFIEVDLNQTKTNYEYGDSFVKPYVNVK